MSIDMGNGVSVRPGRQGRQDAELQARLSGRPVMPRDVQRATERAVALEYGQTAVMVTAVNGAHATAETGVHNLGRLEARVAMELVRNPMSGGSADFRYQGILNDYAAVVSGCVRSFQR